MKVRSIYPLLDPMGMDSNVSHENHERLIEYLRPGREIRIRGDTSHDGESLFVRSRQLSRAEAKEFTSRTFASIQWALEFSGSFKFPGHKKFSGRDHTGQLAKLPASALRIFWADILPSELDLTIQSYLLALTLSFPGTVPTDNVWWLGRERHRQRRYYKSPVREALKFLNEQKVELRNDIGPESAVDWVFRTNGIFDGYSDTPASRSLNFFTRLFVTERREDELSEFVWAVAGIGALLVEGGRSSVGQLRDKLTAIFQTRIDPSWLHKWVSDAYNFRSRMIHGNRQIKSAFRASEDELESRFFEEYHSLLFAVGILLALLQEAIALNVRKFEFATVMKPAT